jgi:hypothetical protein
VLNLGPTLTEKYRLGVFEITTPMNEFGPKREEETGDWTMTFMICPSDQ